MSGGTDVRHGDDRSATREAPSLHLDIASLVREYDGFLVDVWGVIHDGRQPFPGVVEALRALREEGRSVVLLSNSSRPADELHAMLTAMGVDRALYLEAVTSGEACKIAIERMEHPLLAGLPRRCLYIGDTYDLAWIERIGVSVVDRAEDAAFLLLTSIEEFTHPFEHYAPILAAAAERRLPLLCANPDRRVVVAGQHRMGSGTLAAAYEDGGNPVIWFGKPHREVYDLAWEHFRAAGVVRPLAIGDALETDVAGAEAAGIHAALIPGGGVHRAELGIGYADLPSEEALSRLFDAHRTRPDLVLAAFRLAD